MAPTTSASRRPRVLSRRGLVALVPASLAAVATAISVTVVAVLVRTSVGGVDQLDQRAIEAATDVTRDHPALQTALTVWQAASQPSTLYVLATVVCALAWWRGGLRGRAIWAFVTMMVAWNIALQLKYLVRRLRPVLDDPVAAAPGYSFPSGHATNATVAAIAVIILLWPLMTHAQRLIAIGAGVVVVVLTCLDRVFLGVHFPSDVVAGVLVGSGLVIASFLGFRGWARLRADGDVELT